MNKQEEFLKKDILIKKYSNKPLVKFLKYIGLIREINEYETWIKEQTKLMLRWIGTYLFVLPFFIFICLSALRNFFLFLPPPTMRSFIGAVGISIIWYLWIQFLKDNRGAIKNG